MKTIAQQLKIKDFPFIIKDKDGNEIYRENSDGWWRKKEYDSNGREIYHENFCGFWSKKEYDAHGKEIYRENSGGLWSKREYDSNGNEIYWENSDGVIKDNRPKIVEVTLEDIAAKLGINVTQLRIKD
tara:strand:+ start:712 stop:1095 length:384 start_codon:yes stop_codon:yes gene_type:complete